MIYLISMPGGAEWLIVIVLVVLIFLFPILAIYFYAKSKRLMKELEVVTREKNELLKRLLDQK